MKFNLLFLFSFFGSMFICFAQDNEAKKVVSASTNVLFLEMGGSGYLYSANYERLKSLSTRIDLSGRFGVSYFKQNDIVFGAIPVTTSLLIKDNKGKFNLNIGLGIYCSTYPYYYYITPSGLLGLRYNFNNGKNKNYIQLSYTPFVTKKASIVNSETIIKWGVYQWFGFSFAQKF